MELDFVETLFRFSFPALTERKGDRALWSAQLEHAAKGHTQTPALWSETRGKMFLQKRSVAESFLFLFFFLCICWEVSLRALDG